MSAVARSPSPNPDHKCRCLRPATASLDQSPELSAIPPARLLRPNLDRPLHAPTMPAHAADATRQSQHSHRTPPAAVPKSP
jgi:hypothetical protein